MTAVVVPVVGLLCKRGLPEPISPLSDSSSRAGIVYCPCSDHNGSVTVSGCAVFGVDCGQPDRPVERLTVGCHGGEIRSGTNEELITSIFPRTVPPEPRTDEHPRRETPPTASRVLGSGSSVMGFGVEMYNCCTRRWEDDSHRRPRFEDPDLSVLQEIAYHRNVHSRLLRCNPGNCWYEYRFGKQ